MTIQPTRKHIVIELRDSRVTDGIVLPTDTKVQPYALVLRVGPEVTLYKAGDKVAHLPHSNLVCLDEYRPDGTRAVVWIIHEDAVFGVFEGEPAVVTGDTSEPTQMPRSNFNT